MKKLTAFLTAIVIAAGLCACSENSSESKGSSQKSTSSSVSENTAESSQAETAADSSDATVETTTTTAPEVTDGVKRIDPFEGLEVQFDGIAPYVNVSFNNSKCSKEVQDNITFTYDDTANYNNGDKVIVKAELNESADDTEIELLVDEKDYTVQGLPYYVEDFSKVDCSQLYDEAQQYMDAHYLETDPGYVGNTTLNTNNTWTYTKIMGASFKTSFNGPLYGGSVTSNCEGTYQAILKQNRISEFDKDDSYGLNKYNYFYRLYHNVYTMKCGYGDDKGKTEDVDIYVYVWITNVVAYEDGTLKYDVKVSHVADDEEEQAYFNAVSSKNDKYNIKEI